MGLWVLLDLVRSEAAWVASEWSPDDLIALANRGRIRKGRASTHATEARVSAMTRLYRGASWCMSAVTADFVVIHEAVFYDDAPDYKRIRTALGCVGRGGQPHGGKQYWDLPSDWKWTKRLEQAVDAIEASA